MFQRVMTKSATATDTPTRTQGSTRTRNQEQVHGTAPHNLVGEGDITVASVMDVRLHLGVSTGSFLALLVSLATGPINRFVSP